MSDELSRLRTHLSHLRIQESYHKSALKKSQDEITETQRKITEIVDKGQMTMNKELFGD